MPCAVCPSILSTFQSPVLRAPSSVMAGMGENGAGGGTAFLAACWLIQSAAVVAGRPQLVSSNTHKTGANFKPFGTVHPCDSTASDSDPRSGDACRAHCKVRFNPVRQIEDCMRGTSPCGTVREAMVREPSQACNPDVPLPSMAVKP